MENLHKRRILLVLVLLIISTTHMVVSAPDTTNDVEIQTEVKEEVVVEQKTESEPTKIVRNVKEVELLARVIQGESLGENYIGKVAVGAVVLNRMERRNQTMKEVVYAKNQFDCVGGRLFNMEINEDCWSAAIDALDGVDPVDGAEYFHNPKHCKPDLRDKIFVKTIGNHKFYKKKGM